MKYALLATAALLVGVIPAIGADMPAKTAALNAYAAAPACAWNGLYIGAQGGYGSASVDWSGRSVYDESNWLAGGHVGYNYCMGSIVIGLETDAMLGGWKELGWIGSTRGRVGVLLGPSLLVYGTGGVAYGRLDTTLADMSFTGWTAGAGLEYNITRHLSVRAEYRYYDIAVNSVFPHAIVHTGLAGLSVKF
jgi:outer membrane immunogenic protein